MRGDCWWILEGRALITPYGLSSVLQSAESGIFPLRSGIMEGHVKHLGFQLVIWEGWMLITEAVGPWQMSGLSSIASQGARHSRWCSWLCNLLCPLTDLSQQDPEQWWHLHFGGGPWYLGVQPHYSMGFLYGQDSVGISTVVQCHDFSNIPFFFPPAFNKSLDIIVLPCFWLSFSIFSWKWSCSFIP